MSERIRIDAEIDGGRFTVAVKRFSVQTMDESAGSSGRSKGKLEEPARQAGFSSVRPGKRAKPWSAVTSVRLFHWAREAR